MTDSRLMAGKYTIELQTWGLATEGGFFNGFRIVGV